MGKNQRKVRKEQKERNQQGAGNQQSVDVVQAWFEKERSESPPKLPTPQEFCWANEEFLTLEEGTHPRKYAIAAFHRVHQLLKTQETGLDKFLSLKAIMNPATVRRSGAATSIPEGQNQSITWKCGVYDELAELLEGYQDYPADYEGEKFFWRSVFDIILL